MQREKLLVSVGNRISPRGFNFDVILGEGANFNQLRLLSGGLTTAVGAGQLRPGYQRFLFIRRTRLSSFYPKPSNQQDENGK